MKLPHVRQPTQAEIDLLKCHVLRHIGDYVVLPTTYKEFLHEIQSGFIAVVEYDTGDHETPVVRTEMLAKFAEYACFQFVWDNGQLKWVNEYILQRGECHKCTPWIE